MKGQIWLLSFLCLYGGMVGSAREVSLWVPLLALLLAAAVASGLKKRPDFSFVLLALVVAAGYGWETRQDIRWQAAAEALMDRDALPLEVRTLPRETATGYRVDASPVDRRAPFRIRLYMAEKLEPGTLLTLSGSALSQGEPARGRGQPHWGEILRGQKIGLQGFIDSEDFRISGEERLSPGNRILRRQEAFRQRMGQLIPEQSPVIFAALFGDTGGLDETLLEDSRLLGVRHVFAVSGMHVGAFSLLLILLCACLGLTGTLRFGLVTGGLLLFVFLSGGTPSALRAASLLVIYLFSELKQWEKSLARALGLTGIWMLLSHPFYIHSVSFGLSFAAVMGLGFLFPVLKRILPLPGVILAGFSAWSFTLPYQQVFGKSSFLGIFFTALFAPVLLVLVPAGFLVFLLPTALWIPPFFYGLGFLTRLFLLPMHLLTAAPALNHIYESVQLVLPVTGPYRTMAYYGFWLVICLVGNKMPSQDTHEALLSKGEGKVEVSLLTRGTLLASMLLVVTFLITPVVSRGLHLHFLDVGQGDGMVIQKNNRTVLVDGGTPAAGRRAVIPWLQAAGIQRIDLVVSTHSHNDHMGGLFEVLETFDVDRVVLGIDGKDDPDYAAFRDHCQEWGIPVTYLKRGDRFSLGPVRFRVLSPTPQTGGGPNERSLVLDLRYGTFTAQLTGDLEGPALGNLIPPGEEGIFLFKVPHHGSRNSLNRTVLDPLPFDLAVISSGERNPYNHPHPEVITYYGKTRGVPLFRTDRFGELSFRYHGGTLRAKTYLGTGTADVVEWF